MAERFGIAEDGTDVLRVVIERDGLTVNLLTLGAVLQDMRLTGHDHPLVLGYPDLQPYLRNPNYFGATVGRFANRLRNGMAEIDGKPFQMDRNTPQGHQLHGGRDGTATHNWNIAESAPTHVSFDLRLEDGHMGFPGALDVRAIYRILPEQTLEIEICAQTDAPTLCSFAHHSYFNLNGDRTVKGHKLKVLADTFLPVHNDGIPTGKIADVSGTSLDFRTGRVLGDEPIYDHNLCLSDHRGDLRHVAELTGTGNGVALSLATTEPGLQVYTGQGIEQGGAIGLNGAPYGPGAGVALEPQLWPDAPNNTGFPPATLEPGQVYRQVSQFSFRKPVF